VQPLLAAKGHRVHAVNLTGQNGGRKKNAFRITMDDYTEDVIATAEKTAPPVIALGHSMGGFVISAAAQKRPDLFDKLIYLTAVTPYGTTSVFSASRSRYATSLTALCRISLVSASALVRPDTGIQCFYSDCSAADRNAAEIFIQPQPVRPLLSRVGFTQDALGRVPKCYIECLEDEAISIDQQREMQARWGFERVVSIAASHSPFWSQPAQLTELVEGLL
jgi:pimeloyl-ACP methyl ester carboxylesterase